MTKLIMDACCNHLGNMDIIKEMIVKAEKNGADYIKFQLYNHKRLNPDFPKFKEAHANYKKNEIDVSKLFSIFYTCSEVGIIPMFTIFSEDRIPFLYENMHKIQMPIKGVALKIASSDMSNYDLITKVIKQFPDLELFISTGMHSVQDIAHVKQTFSAQKNIKWMYCNSMYPAPEEDIRMSALLDFDGFSDHTIGIRKAKEVVSFDLVDYIEKHFTLSRNLPGKDQFFSIEPNELKELKNFIKYIESIPIYKSRWKG